MHLYVAKIRTETPVNEDIPIAFMAYREGMVQFFNSFLIDDNAEPQQLP